MPAKVVDSSNGKVIRFVSSPLNEKHYVPHHDLLEVQLESFKQFMQVDIPPSMRKEQGLYKVFKENFPITDTREIFVLEFIDYFIEPPEYSEEECRQRGLTYSVSLKARLKLSCTDPEHIEFETVEQEVYLGHVPYMTSRGTFIINGVERVIVSQIHRAPGVLFSTSIHPNGTTIYTVRIIPFKGPWMEMATDHQGVLYYYIDRKKKVPATIILRAMGYGTDKDILSLFDIVESIPVKKTALKKVKGKKIAANIDKVIIEEFVDEDTGEVTTIQRRERILERGTEITDDIIELLLDAGVDEILVFKEKTDYDYTIILNTLDKDPTNSEIEALEYIYRLTKGTEPPDEAAAREQFERIMYSDKRYSLGEVGRYKINKKLGLNIPLDVHVLTKEDFVAIIRRLLDLYNKRVEEDDVDSLAHRRIRTVAEQLYEEFSRGLSRMARTIREKMNVRDSEVFTPADIVNTRALTSVLNQFFATGQLSQFGDQTNPLSETTHKRRITALGPGGLTRENAGFEVRDVHPSHYGRICPIETPEGPNIGLVNTLAVHARLNKMGFLITPYLPVENGVVKLDAEPIYLTAEDEQGKIIAQASVKIDENGKIIQDKVRARKDGDFIWVSPEEVDYIEVATNQILGLAASLIPFIEHDDANRALMGSNMQRQAVPLVKPEPPLVGTGMEAKAAHDSRILLKAEGDGVVEYVDAETIIIRYERDEEEKLVSFDDDKKKYKIPKFQRTNQNTTINLRPLVRKGDRVKKGQILVEGFATANGELALGKNLLVAFMPWKGYNFEDAIIISERLIKDDVYTSIHIEEYDADARMTKAGPEQLTNDIPNVSEDAIKNLDENGLVRVGTRVSEGDILIGKIMPRGESEPTPEEKLLRAIFGDKAGEYKDVSLRAESGFGHGVVIATTLYQRKQKTEYDRERDKKIIDKIRKEYDKKLEDLKKLLIQKLIKVVGGKKAAQDIRSITGDLLIPEGKKITEKLLQKIDDFTKIASYTWTDDEKTNSLIQKIMSNYKLKHQELIGERKRKINNVKVGDELPTGILQLAKVYIAKKRKIKVGDKMAGRHGNKGVVAKIVPEEDMPFLEDGTPVDIVLNPLGVPSRMNIGQIYETILGWAAHKLGVRFYTSSFDGAKLEDIQEYLKKAGLPEMGETYLYDGETGERFTQKVTVGMIYMMKLIHMVEDKIHARAIGPYSLITQQPLGGRSQFGGQRLGEMEVWALEAYGAAYCLQEMLTIKSDDVEGRVKAYEAIAKGENLPKPGIPESFRVLVNELKGLCLDLQFD